MKLYYLCQSSTPSRSAMSAAASSARTVANATNLLQSTVMRSPMSQPNLVLSSIRCISCHSYSIILLLLTDANIGCDKFNKCLIVKIWLKIIFIVFRLCWGIRIAEWLHARPLEKFAWLPKALIVQKKAPWYIVTPGPPSRSVMYYLSGP